VAFPTLVIFLYHIWHLIKKSDKLESYCYNSSNPTLIRSCAGIFPIHFAILEQWYLQMKIDSIMNKEKFPDLAKPHQTRLKDVRKVYTEVYFKLVSPSNKIWNFSSVFLMMLKVKVNKCKDIKNPKEHKRCFLMLDLILLFRCPCFFEIPATYRFSF